MEQDLNKSYVGMANCFLCGEVKNIILDRRLKNSLPQNAVYDREPCDKCKEIMKQGIMFIGVRDGETGDNPYRTGQIIGVKDEAVKNIIHEPLLSEVLKTRICYIEENVLIKMGLLKEDKTLKFKKER
jgi:hypothetical protein